MNQTRNETTLDRIRQVLAAFFKQQSAGGVILLLCAAIAMALANSPLASAYESQFSSMEVPAFDRSISLLYGFFHP